MLSAQQQAAIDFNMKLRFERKLLKAVKSINTEMVRLYSRSVLLNGVPPEFTIFQDKFETVFNDYYHEVGQIFTEKINDHVNDSLKNIDSDIKIKMKYYDYIENKAKKKLSPVSIVVSRYYDYNSIDQSKRITETTRRQAQEALNMAHKSLPGASLTQLEVSNTAAGIFNRKLRGREVDIVMFQTQFASEAAKLTQVEILSGIEPSLSSGSNYQSKILKEWVNMGDSKVRAGDKFNHLFAEQRVPINEPFIVSGEKLRFPGDTGLGASLGNVINCRCSAIYDPEQIAEKMSKR